MFELYWASPLISKSDSDNSFVTTNISNISHRDNYRTSIIWTSLGMLGKCLTTCFSVLSPPTPPSTLDEIVSFTASKDLSLDRIPNKMFSSHSHSVFGSIESHFRIHFINQWLSDGSSSSSSSSHILLVAAAKFVVVGKYRLSRQERAGEDNGNRTFQSRIFGK